MEEEPVFYRSWWRCYMSLIQYSRVKQVDLQEEFHRGSWSNNMSWQQLSVLDKACKDFKERKGKIDFIDMIERFIKAALLLSFICLS